VRATVARSDRGEVGPVEGTDGCDRAGEVGTDVGGGGAALGDGVAEGAPERRGGAGRTEGVGTGDGTGGRVGALVRRGAWRPGVTATGGTTGPDGNARFGAGVGPTGVRFPAGGLGAKPAAAIRSLVGTGRAGTVRGPDGTPVGGAELR
jgi:hypothetical protein